MARCRSFGVLAAASVLLGGCSLTPVPSPSWVVTRRAAAISDPMVSCADLPGTFEADLPSYLSGAPRRIGLYDLRVGESVDVGRLYLALGYRTVKGGPPGGGGTYRQLDLVTAWLTGDEAEPLVRDAHWTGVRGPNGYVSARRVHQYRVLFVNEDEQGMSDTFLIERLPCAPELRLDPLAPGAARELWMSSRGAELVEVPLDDRAPAAGLHGPTISLVADRLDLRVPGFDDEALKHVAEETGSLCAGHVHVRALQTIRSSVDLHVRIRVERRQGDEPCGVPWRSESNCADQPCPSS